MATPGEAYRNTLRAAGITPDRPTSKPLFEILNAAFEDRQEIKAAILRLRDPLPADKMDRAVSAFLQRSGWMLFQAYWWVAAGVAGSMLALGVALGWWLGSAQPVPPGMVSAATARVLAMNDMDAVADPKRCVDVPQPRGGEACAIVVWKNLPAPAGGGRP